MECELVRVADLPGDHQWMLLERLGGRTPLLAVRKDAGADAVKAGVSAAVKRMPLAG